ncbi:uncharacterized protein ZK1073.1 isoform X2 [Papilio machaon]|uniref:uncharacterized protein ZK1073.1 isoform X2 n=1 Tax=Papilio machaon TaxID=76193 RepID=UPI001E664654|nr:uncharacterized protein ZK1073.1 isoform X2 [Papilio machaon]
MSPRYKCTKAGGGIGGRGRATVAGAPLSVLPAPELLRIGVSLVPVEVEPRIPGPGRAACRLGQAASLSYGEKEKYVVSTDRSGDIHVHVQGDLSQQDKRCVFLTVHDLGTNHSSLVDFVNCPAMAEIKERSCFIHVDVPGHEENSPDLPESYPFPSLQTLGEDLVTVLDFLRVRYAVGLGEGAGANVLARCGLAHPARLLGLVLVNCTASTSSVADAFRSRFSRWRGADISHSEEDFLIYHKFGHQIPGEGERERTLSEYRSRLRGNLNPHNLKQYVRAFINRKDLVLRGCRPDLLLVTGTRSPYASVVEKMYRDLDKEKVTILKVDNAGDVLTEAPAKVAVSLLLFCQGQGLLTSLPPPGVERRMSRNISMEEYDTPNIRRLSLTPAPATAANTTP